MRDSWSVKFFCKHSIGCILKKTAMEKDRSGKRLWG
jgi:hypothetical protein